VEPPLRKTPLNLFPTTSRKLRLFRRNLLTGQKLLQCSKIKKKVPSENQVRAKDYKKTKVSATPQSTSKCQSQQSREMTPLESLTQDLPTKTFEIVL